ncbi:hypothetical protein ISCGN_032137 [Ixodes scapularis]
MASMKVQDLKKELKARGLSTAGNKTELIERLQAIGDAPKNILLDLQSGVSSEELLASTAAAEEDEVFSGRQLIPPTASQDDAEEYVDCADESPATGTTFDPKGLQDGLESQTTEQFSPSGTLLDTVQIAGFPEIRRQDCDAGSTQGPSEVGEGFVPSQNCGGLALEDYATTNMASNESSIERCKICNYMEASLSTHRKKIEELEIQVTSLTERLQQAGLDKNKVDQLLQMMGSAERERRENAAEREALKELLARCEVLEKERSGLLVKMGGGQNFDVLLNRKATVEIAHRMIADYEATARRIPRMYILHVGMQDLLQGQQPDDIVESLEKKWCF